MSKFQCAVALALIGLSTVAVSTSCVDKLDSYSDYDNTVSAADIRAIRSDSYLLSYGWSAAYCDKISSKSKRPGQKDYLQCGSGRKFAYILHGLWPQSAASSSADYPRACLGDQLKIARTDLQPFLCMTPSVWLLQHEYEYHGTCMADPQLRSPVGYLSKAQAMHRQLNLPLQQLNYAASSLRWWYSNNPHLVAGSVKYQKKSQQWQFCYDNGFQSVSCPASDSTERAVVPADVVDEVDVNRNCKIKGNISKRSGRKYYFLPQHRNYQSVVINVAAGERCFDTQSQARAALWQKAPN
ncbi:MAG: hypothetical protein OFPI_19320 [Osedax symbiont Rs2]|nr:MAG: hypothetical protein OFPI_19320 [Osedax symbiont Rs2]